MDNIYINFLLFKFKQYHINSILIIDDALDVDEIIRISGQKKIFVGVENTFLRQKHAAQLRAHGDIVVEPLNSSIYKQNFFDAVISKNVNEDVLGLFKNVNFFFSRSLLVDRMFIGYDKDTEFLLMKKNFQPIVVNENAKIGFAITMTSSRFKIVEQQLTYLDNVLKNTNYDSSISVFCDEELNDENKKRYDELSSKFSSVIFKNEYVKSVAKAKNRSIQPLIDNDCEFYFCLDDDAIIVDRRAIDYYIEACKQFHFLHLHLIGYLKEKETQPILIKSYKNFDVLSYNYDTGCFIVFDRHVLEKCGKWDERFEGWGEEHKEFGSRVERILLNDEIHHLAIPEVYENNYVIALDAKFIVKLKQYNSFENLTSLMTASNISYDRNETNEKNINLKNSVSINDLLNDEVLIKFFNELSIKYDLKTKFNKKKCVIIGSAPSIYGYNLKDYIDNEDAIVLRINRYPKEDLYQFYGSKTDYIITWSVLHNDKDDPTNDEKFIIFQDELSNNNKNIKFLINELKKYFKISDNYVMTTGFFTILMSLFLFDKVEIFGFGFSETEISNNVSYSYDVTKVHYTKNHDFNLEHHIFDKLISIYSSKIKRLEDEYSNKIDPINIAFTIDDKYAKMTMQSINEIILNKNKLTKINFYVLMNNVSNENKNKFKLFNNVKNINVKTIDVTSFSKKLINVFDEINRNASNRYVSSTCFIRCFLYKFLNDIDKVLYLDPDIFVKNDLSELFNSNFENKSLIAVKDFGICNVFKYNEKLCSNIVNEKRYFCSGILMMNLKKIRSYEPDFGDKCLEILLKYKPLDKDQAVLNYICSNNNDVKYVDSRFSFSYHYTIIMKINGFTNLNKYNELYETKYKSFNELCDKSVIWHFHGNKDDQMKNPILKKIWDESEQRLNQFLKYFT